MTENKDPLDRCQSLSVLTRAPADEVKQFAERLIPQLGEIQVLVNRTGLVMLPMVDTVQGAQFYVGEVLTAEARVLAGGVEGYAACMGRDHEQALALALIDAALAAGMNTLEIESFIHSQQTRLEEADRALLREVEATRVEMETFEWQLPK